MANKYIKEIKIEGNDTDSFHLKLMNKVIVGTQEFDGSKEVKISQADLGLVWKDL